MDYQTLEAQHSVLELTEEVLKALLEESQEIGLAYLHRGYYTYQEIRRVKEITRLVAAGGLTW